jgi:hypothetical protein
MTDNSKKRDDQEWQEERHGIPIGLLQKRTRSIDDARAEISVRPSIV